MGTLHDVKRENATIYELNQLEVSEWTALVQVSPKSNLPAESVASDIALLPGLYRQMKEQLKYDAKEHFGMNDEEFQIWFEEEFPDAMRLNYL